MVVVDASVVYKWFASEEQCHAQALELLKSHLDKENRLVVPDLILSELANVWSIKTNLSLRKIYSNLRDLKNINLQVEIVTIELAKKAIAFARKYRISAYDAIYAVLAKEKKCELITADSKFVDKVKLKFVKQLEKR